jgi:hypothetical protein
MLLDSATTNLSQPAGLSCTLGTFVSILGCWIQFSTLGGRGRLELDRLDA